MLLGAGAVGRAVASAAPARCFVVATTRSADRAPGLRAAGICPIVAPALSAAVVEPLAAGADVLVSFPPDGVTDSRVARACVRARAVVYISSTGVYGRHRGRVDDTTPSAPDDAAGRARLEAESVWRDVGAVVLRAPAIYGPGHGLHTRLASGTYRLPGDGSGVVSRIHVADLATFVLAAFERAPRAETYVVGDLAPVAQREVVAWLTAELGLPMPPSAPIDAVPATLRASRAVDPSRALADLGVELAYPSYREGFGALLGGR